MGGKEVVQRCLKGNMAMPWPSSRRDPFLYYMGRWLLLTGRTSGSQTSHCAVSVRLLCPTYFACPPSERRQLRETPGESASSPCLGSDAELHATCWHVKMLSANLSRRRRSHTRVTASVAWKLHVGPGRKSPTIYRSPIVLFDS